MENKDSKDILPKEERLKQIDLISDVVDLEYCLKYHKALESSEERVKQLEEELLAEIKLRHQREKECAEEFEEKKKLEEENTRLKGLLKEGKDLIGLFISFGIIYPVKGVSFPSPFENPEIINHQKTISLSEDWCKKNNINL